MLSYVEKYVERKGYTKEELEGLLGESLIDIVGDIQRADEVLKANKEFRIYEAAYHVYSEAGRVLEFINVCKSDKTNKEKVHLLGDLMNKSQDSCRDLY